MKNVVENILLMLWYIVVFGTFTYLIFWKGQSGAWYIFAVFLMAIVGVTDNDKKKKEKE